MTDALEQLLPHMSMVDEPAFLGILAHGGSDDEQVQAARGGEPLPETGHLVEEVGELGLREVISGGCLNQHLTTDTAIPRCGASSWLGPRRGVAPLP